MMAPSSKTLQPCQATATRPSHRANQTITQSQIAFDLCYLAKKIYPENQGGQSPKFDAQGAYQIESAMQDIVIEGSLLKYCPAPIPSGQNADASNDDYELDRYWGCGPYPATYQTPLASAETMSTTTCESHRPAPNPLVLDLSHPPMTRELAAFDLCHAASKIATMPKEAIEPYMQHLQMAVHLALTCSGSRNANIYFYESSATIPSQDDASFIMTRRYGCSPKPNSTSIPSH